MFLRRSIAAEVCMEACANRPAYTALKKLDRRDELRFHLRCITGLPSSPSRWTHGLLSHSDVVTELLSVRANIPALFTPI